MATPYLVLDRVRVVIGAAAILEGVTTTVSKREFVCVIGTSGGGKTTLLRTIAGLLPLAGGSITLGGTPVAGPSRKAAMVFQHFGLFPWKTVRSNVAYGLSVQGRPLPKGRVDQLLDMMGLDRVAGYYPAQLSGGMKQRVGIARALAVEPELLLLDEPFSSLDAITRERLQDEVLRLWDGDDRMTALLVTHDIDEAILMGDRVVVLSGPPGRITASVDVGLPRPRTAQDIRTHPEYPRLRRSLRDALNDQVVPLAEPS